MRLCFLTSTPLDFRRGSGTFAGVTTLASALGALGVEVETAVPRFEFPVYTARRLWFNEQLRRRRWTDYDAVVGFDMDGYRIAGRSGTPHVACIKGVIADELRFERGLTRITMSAQAACERAHVRRADLVVATSSYSARRIAELYGVSRPPVVVPELVDLAAWNELFTRCPARPDPSVFSVLSVCRFYPRKRLNVLLEAAARLRGEIRNLEVRIVGDGPEAKRLRALSRALELDGTVRWLGDLPQAELAREYQRCHAFCLPSVQEGFGIVFLEAMAAGKPIVASRAAAAPETVAHGLLVEPDNAEALAEALRRLRREPELAAALGAASKAAVVAFNATDVARRFLAEVAVLL